MKLIQKYEIFARAEILLRSKAKMRAMREFIFINDRLSTFLTQLRSKRAIVRRSRLGVLLLLQILATGAFADKQAVEQLTALLENTRAYQANFKQVTLGEGGNAIQTFDGKLSVKRPGLFYWHVNPPVEQIVVSDGNKLWVYDPDLEQAIIQKVDHRISQTPALLLSGEVATLDKSFDISTSPGKAGQQYFTLVPKDQDSLFEQLKFTFADKVLVQMHLVDALGQRSSFEFVDVQVNPQIDSKLFNFTPPEGVDVIEQ